MTITDPEDRARLLVLIDEMETTVASVRELLGADPEPPRAHTTTKLVVELVPGDVVVSSVSGRLRTVERASDNGNLVRFTNGQVLYQRPDHAVRVLCEPAEVVAREVAKAGAR